MISKIIEWSLRNRFLVLCGALLLIGLSVMGSGAERLAERDTGNRILFTIFYNLIQHVHSRGLTA